jgi:hypothetical protein
MAVDAAYRTSGTRTTRYKASAENEFIYEESEREEDQPENLHLRASLS